MTSGVALVLSLGAVVATFMNAPVLAGCALGVMALAAVGYAVWGRNTSPVDIAQERAARKRAEQDLKEPVHTPRTPTTLQAEEVR